MNITSARRTLILAVATTSVAILVAAATLFQPSQARADTAAECGTYFIGVHGMNQGPDQNGQIPEGGVPHEVLRTSSAFRDAMTEAGGAIAGSGLLWYPIARSGELSFWADIVARGVLDGAQELQRMIDDLAKSCPGMRFVLNGYSQGAWVINCWLHGNMPGAAEHTCKTGTGGGRYYDSIAGVLLYGDPQWDVPPDKGIARLTIRALNPYKPAGLFEEGRFRSVCAQGDPICGHKINNNDFEDRRRMAQDCARNPSCPHFVYANSGWMESEGQWLASVALRP